MKQGIIYKITSPSGKIYIGQSINLTQRIRSYKKLHCKSQPKLYNSILKYGWDEHTFEIIETIENDENKVQLNLREIYWIEFYDCLLNGLNCTKGGDGQVGRIISKETKEKLSKAKLGKKIHLGFKNSEESKKLMSEKAKLRPPTRTGSIVSDETKLKISQSKKGKPGVNNGRIFNEETRRKMSEAAKNRNYNSKRSMSRKLIDRLEFENKEG